jgi:hypothetical protein
MQLLLVVLPAQYLLDSCQLFNIKAAGLDEGFVG